MNQKSKYSLSMSIEKVVSLELNDCFSQFIIQWIKKFNTMLSWLVLADAISFGF